MDAALHIEWGEMRYESGLAQTQVDDERVFGVGFEYCKKVPAEVSQLCWVVKLSDIVAYYYSNHALMVERDQAETELAVELIVVEGLQSMETPLVSSMIELDQSLEHNRQT